MATIDRKAYSQVLTSALTTELNALANAAQSAASATIDNSTNLDIAIDLMLNCTWGTNPTAGNTVDVYMIPSLDNTTFADSAVLPINLLVATLPVRAVTTIQHIVAMGATGPGGTLPQYFKLIVVNNSGFAFPATGTTLQYRTYAYTVA